ncbi:MAG: hypothetical protein DME94_11050, partial [Verrucomicrobia bacterium]
YTFEIPAPQAFLRPLGSGGRRSGCSGKNHRRGHFYHRQRRACYPSYPLATAADNDSKTRIATESGSSFAHMKTTILPSTNSMNRSPCQWRPRNGS